MLLSLPCCPWVTYKLSLVRYLILRSFFVQVPLPALWAFTSPIICCLLACKYMLLALLSYLLTCICTYRGNSCVPRHFPVSMASRASFGDSAQCCSPPTTAKHAKHDGMASLNILPLSAVELAMLARHLHFLYAPSLSTPNTLADPSFSPPSQFIPHLPHPPPSEDYQV